MKTDERSATFADVLPQLAEEYKAWKEHEAGKNRWKEAFFALADEALCEEGLGYRMAELPAESNAQAQERARLHYPEWIVDEVRPHRSKAGVFEVLLSENPSLTGFAYEHDGFKYARTVSKGTVMIDDEWLRDAEPELYDAVTYELPWGDRISVPVEHLDAALIGSLTKYLYNAAPKVSLAKPRAIKTED